MARRRILRRKRRQIGEAAIDGRHRLKLRLADAKVRAHVRHTPILERAGDDDRRELRRSASERDIDHHSAAERQLVPRPGLATKPDVPRGNRVRSAKRQLQEREAAGRASRHRPLDAGLAVSSRDRRAREPVSRAIPDAAKNRRVGRLPPRRCGDEQEQDDDDERETLAKRNSAHVVPGEVEIAMYRTEYIAFTSDKRLPSSSCYLRRRRNGPMRSVAT